MTNSVRKALPTCGWKRGEPASAVICLPLASQALPCHAHARNAHCQSSARCCSTPAAPRRPWQGPQRCPRSRPAMGGAGGDGHGCLGFAVEALQGSGHARKRVLRRALPAALSSLQLHSRPANSCTPRMEKMRNTMPASTAAVGAQQRACVNRARIRAAWQPHGHAMPPQQAGPFCTQTGSGARLPHPWRWPFRPGSGLGCGRP